MSDIHDFDLSGFEVQGSTGLDCFFQREPEIVTPTKKPSRIRVASIQDLSGFTRISSDTLIHKSDRDLWAIKRQGDGSLFVERQFDDNGDPLKV
jgi:hypothetical protein